MKNTPIIHYLTVPGIILFAATGACAQRLETTRGSSDGLVPHQIFAILGARGEKGVTSAQSETYRRIFARVDADQDGRLSKEEFIEKGTYLTERARTGIFAASDDNRDDFVSKSEYIRNRSITDEAKQIVGRMDTNRNGSVSLQEFLDHSRVKDRQTDRQIFRLLDTDSSGDLMIPEYLRVWGRWARDGKQSDTNRGHKRSQNTDLLGLPEIDSFATSKSNRFVVDLESVRTGHPYKGTDASQSHTGAHIYFNLPDRPVPASDVEAFPAIYAVADGYVSRIDEYFKLRESFNRTLGKSVANRRYGVTLAIAVKDGAAVNFHYSIEPMIDPEDADFYKPFILVKHGQHVKKGEVIARMYMPPQTDFARNTHIHFNLVDTGQRQFMAPTIFTERINQRFHAAWGERGIDGGDRIPPCMGYRLSGPENPFGTGAKETL
ncbi:MAG: hypothetical protein GY903_17520 [Fuerstiella sp.]|nr:hypothetical protein [Fuerstiella sp.]MCP4856284.1 hypothetical protein [Fuerstiella sp.]